MVLSVSVLVRRLPTIRKLLLLKGRKSHAYLNRFVGTWRTLSKLVVIIVMIRGRHRGLPVAVSRICLYPTYHVSSR